MSSVLKGTAPQGGDSGKTVGKAVRSKTVRGDMIQSDTIRSDVARGDSVRGERRNGAAASGADPSGADPSGAAVSDAVLDAALNEAAAGEAVFSEESAAEEQEAHGHVGQSGFFGRFEGSGERSPRRREPASIDEFQISNRGLQHAIDALHAANVDLRAKGEVLRGTLLELRQMLDNVELGVMLLDEGLVLLQFNAMAGQFLDLDLQDLGNPIGASCRGLSSQLETWCYDVARSGRRAEHACRSAIGEPLRVRIRSVRINGAGRLILVFAEAPAE